MTWTKKVAPLLFWVALLFVAAPAQATQRVLVVRPSPGDATLYEAFGRLRGELELQSFEVVVLDSGGAPVSAEELERHAQESGAFAAVALQRLANGANADVCIVDRITGKTSTRKLAIDRSSDGPTLLAVRAVDLLRASLVELPPGERPSADVLGVEAAPPAPEVARFSQDPRRYQLRAGGLLLADPALGAGLGVTLSFDVQPISRWTVGVQFGGPLFGAQFTSDNGVATVRQELVLVRTAWNLSASNVGPRFAWGPLLGVGLFHLEASGVVTPPLSAQSNDVWGFAASAGLGAQYFLDDRVSLAVDLTALLHQPPIVIAIDDQRSSTVFLRALASVGLGVSY